MAAPDDDRDAPWRRFTPARVGQGLCLARTWNKGLGGQCTRARPPDGSDFCNTHAGEKWKVHGAVNGPIPEKKLREFEKVAAAASGSPKAPAAAGKVLRDTSSDGAAAKATAPAAAVPAKPAKPPSAQAAPGAPAPAKPAKPPPAQQAAALGRRAPDGPSRGAKRSAADALLTDRARQRFGVLSPEQLRAAEPKVLSEVIREGTWSGEGWEELAGKLEAGDAEAKEEAVEKISAKWQSQVKESLKVMRAELEKHREAARQQKEEKENRRQSTQKDGESASKKTTMRVKAAAKDMKFTRKVLGAKAAKAPKEKRCTCGCPIHQERCPLFRPPRYTSYTTFIGAGRTPHQDSRIPPGGFSSKPLGKAPFTLSQWASQEISRIVADVASLPRPEWKGAYRRNMLLFHPDKRMAPGNPFAERSAEQVTEVFMELKRRYDRMDAGVPGGGGGGGGGGAEQVVVCAV